MAQAIKHSNLAQALQRIAVRVLAQIAAKNVVKNQIRAEGLRISDYSNKDLRPGGEA